MSSMMNTPLPCVAMMTSCSVGCMTMSRTGTFCISFLKLAHVCPASIEMNSPSSVPRKSRFLLTGSCLMTWANPRRESLVSCFHVRPKFVEVRR